MLRSTFQCNLAKARKSRLFFFGKIRIFQDFPQKFWFKYSHDAPDDTSPPKRKGAVALVGEKSVGSSTQIRRLTRSVASPDAQKPKNEHGRIPTNVKEGTSCHWCRLSCFLTLFLSLPTIKHRYFFSLHVRQIFGNKNYPILARHCK